MNMDEKIMGYFKSFKGIVECQKAMGTFKSYDHIDTISKLALMSNFCSIHIGIEIMEFINKEVLNKNDTSRN